MNYLVNSLLKNVERNFFGKYFRNSLWVVWYVPTCRTYRSNIKFYDYLVL